MAEASMKPTRKMQGVGLGGALGVIAVWLIQSLGGIQVPSEVAGAISVLMAFAVGYITEER